MENKVNCCEYKTETSELERFEANQDRKFDQIRREIKETHQKLEQVQQKLERNIEQVHQKLTGSREQIYRQFEYGLGNKIGQSGYEIKNSIQQAFNELMQKMNGLTFDIVMWIICLTTVQTSLILSILSGMKAFNH